MRDIRQGEVRSTYMRRRMGEILLFDADFAVGAVDGFTFKEAPT